MRTDPAFMRIAVDKCLERLETDYIDVLQLHNAKMEHVRDAELWETLRELQREGKIRAWGAAFGPAIGWLYEAVELVEREPDINTIQMIWNVLEQHPGLVDDRGGATHAPNCCFNVRVTHASGMLEGKYTEDTVFPENDHRRHRPRSWLVNGVEKVKTLDFLTERMTLGQAALKWLLAEPRVVTTLPNIYDDEQLAEFAAASDLPDLSAEDDGSRARARRRELRRRGGADELQGDDDARAGCERRPAGRAQPDLSSGRAGEPRRVDAQPVARPSRGLESARSGHRSHRDPVGQPQQVRARQGERAC